MIDVFVYSVALEKENDRDIYFEYVTESKFGLDGEKQLPGVCSP